MDRWNNIWIVILLVVGFISVVVLTVMSFIIVVTFPPNSWLTVTDLTLLALVISFVSVFYWDLYLSSKPAQWQSRYFLHEERLKRKIVMAIIGSLLVSIVAVVFIVQFTHWR